MKNLIAAFTCIVLVLSGSPVFAQDPYNHPLIVVDYPSEGGSTGRNFSIRGTALNTEQVHVWAVPPGVAPILLGVAYPYAPDPLRKIQGGSFSLAVYDLPVGNYPIVAYPYEAYTNSFPVGLVVNLQVHTCINQNVTWPFYGVTGWVMLTYQVCR